jgi:DNA-binding LacI/PurR family transcriptional regulator
MRSAKSANQARTLADLAALANVSASTVSRALNDSPLVNAETRAQIKALAAEHKFQVHLGAQSLRRQRTQTLAVVITAERPAGNAMTDPFLLELLGEIAAAASQRGYDILLADARGDLRDWNAHFLRSGRADGLIMVARLSERTRQTNALYAASAPFVVWGPALPNQPYCSVGSDDFTGGKLATNHLLRLGRRHIGFLGAGSDCLEVALRYQGYVAALTDAGQPVREQDITYAISTSQAGFEAMRRLLVQAPDLDAVFVNSDVMAVGAIEALHATGRRTPQDVAIVGYDDISVASYLRPPLTTVRQRLHEAARLLVERLGALIEGDDAAPVVLPVDLIVRESCGALLR